MKLLPSTPKPPSVPKGAPLPHGISLAVISQEVANREEQRGVGLLRRLSIDAGWRARIESDVNRLLSSRSPVTVDAHTSILGLRSEGRLGYAYDDLGVFPAFVDALGREYFFVGNGTEFYVRIPRGQTRRQNETAYTAKEGAPFTQLPTEREELVLQALRPPFFPLRYVPATRNVDVNAAAAATTLAIVSPVYATVSSVRSEIEASCHVTLRVNEDPQRLVNTIAAVRAAYSRDVQDFVVAVCRDLPPQVVLEVSEYLQRVWASKAREWVKYGKK